MPSPAQPHDASENPLDTSQYQRTTPPWIAPYQPPQQSPLNIGSNLSAGVNWGLPSSVPTQSGIFGGEIREIEEYIQSASIKSPAGETGITYREYTLGRVLAALADFQLAPDEFGEERTVRSLLQRTVGADFDHGNFQSYIEGMLDTASADELARLYEIDPQYAESARLLTVEILCFPPLAGLLLATAREVQETVFTSCRALLTRGLDAVREEGKSINDPEVVNALFSSYTQEFEAVLREGLQNSLMNPFGTRSLEEAVNRLYAQVAAQLQIAFQRSGYSEPPGYIRHEPTSFGTTELLGDLFLLVQHNRLIPENIRQVETASQYLLMLREWKVTAEYYQGLKNPLSEQLPRGTKPMITELQRIADLTPKKFDSQDTDLFPAPPTRSSAAASASTQQRGRSERPTDRRRSHNQSTQTNEHLEAGNSSVDDIGGFINTMLDTSPQRAMAIFAITASAVGLNFLDHDYRAVLIGLAAWVLTYDKPERFNTVIESLGAYAIRGASTGALVAGAMTTSIPYLGQLRYVLDGIPIPTDYLQLLVGAAIISEGWLWFARANQMEEEGAEYDEDQR